MWKWSAATSEIEWNAATLNLIKGGIIGGGVTSKNLGAGVRLAFDFPKVPLNISANIGPFSRMKWD